MCKASVIVPVYNSSKYLHRCLDSILNQTFRDFELILINDGSTDNSIDILREYESKDSRIVMIDKVNEGVSAARNQGIEIAKGEYIMFCDSDDYVDENWILVLLDGIKNNCNSWVNCEYYTFSSVTDRCILHKLNSISTNQIISLENYYMYYTNNYSHSCCNRIYRKDVIYKFGIRFPINISVGEDVLFNIQYIKHCKNFYHIAQGLYFWNDENCDSLSRKTDLFYYDTLKTLYFPRLEVVSERDKQAFIDEYFFRFYQCLDDLSNSDYKEKVRYGNYILKDSAFIHALKNTSENSCNNKLKTMLSLHSFNVFLLYKKLRGE